MNKKQSKEIDWNQVDKESKEHLKKVIAFEENREKEDSNNKSLQEMVNEVNQFIEENNIESFQLEIKEKK